MPGAVLVAATLALLIVPPLRAATVSLVPAYPYAAFASGLLLAWRFARHRVLFMVLLLAAAERLLVLAPGTRLAGVVVGAAAVALAANLAVLAWLPDRLGFGAVAASTLGLLGLEAVLAALVAQPEAVSLAATTLLPLPGWGRLGGAGLAAFALAIGLAATRAVTRPQPIECGTLWALVAALLGFAGVQRSSASLAFAGAGLVLAVALVEASHVIAYGDELTGLPGRRALTEALARLDGTYTIAMVDIDHFKRFNDTYGHDTGDQLLRMVGARLGEVGGGGRAFRYGGEEFAILFPGAVVEDALPYLESLRRTIQTTGFGLRGKDRPRHKTEPPPRPSSPAQRVSVAVSIGVAGAPRRGARSHDVLDAADAALYRAKRGGRNRVCT